MSMPHKSRGGCKTLTAACLCVYSGTALVAAFVEAFLWSTRGALGVVAACRGEGLWPREPPPPTPGTGDSLWSYWPVSVLVGLAAGAMWPLWAVAATILLRRRRQQQRRRGVTLHLPVPE